MLRPLRRHCSCGFQVLVGRPYARKEALEVRGMNVARDEREHFQRAQQRIEHSDDGLDLRLVHGVPLPR